MDLKKVPTIEITSAKDFFTLLPDKIEKEWLKDIETNFHFDIAGERGGLFSVSVLENRMEIHECLNGEAKCIIKTKDVHFIKLLKGEMNPVMALLTGKLKVSDQEEIMKHARLLGLM